MGKFTKFLSVGLVSTLLQFLLLLMFVELGWLNEVLASAAAYLLSAVFNYVANYKLTFASQQSHASTLPKFAVAAMIGALINTLVFALAFTILKSSWVLPWFAFLQDLCQPFLSTSVGTWIFRPYLWAQGVATAITLVINFMIHTFWIYKKG
jgi:putative flippase GtrA